MKLRGQVRRVPRRQTRWSGTKQTPRKVTRQYGYTRAQVNRIYRRAMLNRFRSWTVRARGY